MNDIAKAPLSWNGTVIHTIGHSTRALDELAALLRESGVDTLADIRTVPRSRHNPQFNADTLGAALAPHGIRYVPIAALGGLRRARKDSPNAAWRNASFRGYADYMGTAEFERGLDELRAVAADGAHVALMCAEAVPWRCHRSLVADVLAARGGDVRHIVGQGPPRPHKITPFAKIHDGRVTYPADAGDASDADSRPA
ncbi:MAG TPA: DUF488 domain-containing protein [Gammaproteobacteria bacterium]|nr:DUF488 domain-containing protein [Gammaproteobacteria bacterium]